MANDHFFDLPVERIFEPGEWSGRFKRPEPFKGSKHLKRPEPTLLHDL